MKKLTSKEDCAKIYTAILTRMGTEIYNTTQVYSLIKEIKEEFGGEYSLLNNPTDVIRRLSKLVGKDNYEMVDDDSIKLRGRNSGNGYLINFKNIEEGIKRIRHHYKVEPITKKEETTDIEVITEEEPVVEKKFKKISERKLNTVRRIWKWYTDSVSRDKTQYTSEEISKIFGISYQYSKTHLDLLENSLTKMGIVIKFHYTAGPRTNTYYIEPNMPINTLKSISGVMKKDYGIEEFNSRPYIKKEENPEKAINPEELTEEDQQILAFCADELMRVGNLPQQTSILRMLLEREFNISIKEDHIVTLLTSFPDQFEVLEQETGYTRVKLVKEPEEDVISEAEDNKESTHDTIPQAEQKESKERKVPEKKKTLVRLSVDWMTILGLFPETTIASRISDEDNIFEIPYEENRFFLAQFSKLYLRMHGTEKFLDSDFEKRIIDLTTEIYNNYINQQ